MKRAFPQKVKPVSFYRSLEAAAQSKQAASGVNRRARTSAAMVGLALSMGAASILLPRQGDGAVAAEPQATESHTTIASPDPQAVATPETAAEPASIHQIRQGQTLWQVAHKYRVGVAALAAANGIAPDATLHPGQTLIIPVSAASPSSAAVVTTTAPSSDDLKVAQDSAIVAMRQQRNRLQTSLTQLQAPTAPEAAQAESTEGMTLQDFVKSEATAAEAIASSPAAIPQQQGAVDVARVAASPVPVSRPEAIAPRTDIAYRVTSGDTLGKIADFYNIPQRALAAANSISNPNLIVVNQVLSIPATTAAQAAQATSQSAGSPVESVAVAEADATAASQYYPMVTVPTVPAASATPEPVTIATVPPAAIPAQQAVAIASPSVPHPDRPAQVPSSAASAGASTNPYVENLMAEILSMRDRYRSSEQTAAQPIVPTTPATPVQVASNARSAAQRPTPSDALEAAPQSQPPAATARPTANSEQLVAVAPLGAQNYAPLSQPITGRAVSPDLPPLPSAEAFLPEGAPTFDGYRWPARGVITSGYGWRWGRMHRGIDIGAPTGTPVVAAAAGEIVFSGWNSGGYGNLVEIRHPDGSLTRYAHNSRILVRQGQQVEQGQQISAVGSTGYSTGPHLHFEVHPANQGAVNPIAFLPSTRE